MLVSIKKLWLTIFTTILCLIFIGVLLLPNMYRIQAIKVADGSIVGDDAKVFSVDNNVYVISSTSKKIVLSKVSVSGCETLKEFLKDTYDSAIESFYGCQITCGSVYVIESFKYEDNNNKIKVIKSDLGNLSNESECTIVGKHVNSYSDFAFFDNDSVIIVDSDDKTKLNFYSDIFTRLSSEQVSVSVKYIEQVRPNLSGNKVYVSGKDFEYKDKFIYVSPGEAGLAENDAGVYLESYRFVDDNLIVSGGNKFYENKDGLFKYKFNSYSGSDEVKSCIFGEYILMSLNDRLLYAVDQAGNDVKLQLELTEDIIDMGADDTNLFTLHRGDGFYYIDSFLLDYFKSVVPKKYISDIPVRTEDDINKLYSDCKPENDSKDNVYVSRADLENFSTAGSVTDIVENDGLKTINFYRELYGLKDAKLDSELSSSAQCGAVLSLVSDGTVKPDKPEKMSDDFYNKAMGVYDRNCMIIRSNLSAIPISDAVHHLFSRNFYFREKLLDSNVTKIGAGVCSDNEGKTAVLIKFEDREKYCNSYNFTPYFRDGFYPISLVQEKPVLSVELGKSMLIGDRGSLHVKVTDVNTGGTHELVYGRDFVYDDFGRGLIITDIGFELNKSSNVLVYVGNLVDEDGNVCEIEYSTQLFELKDGPSPIDPDDPSISDITSEVYNIDDDNLVITGIEPGTTVAQIKENISYDGYDLVVVNYKNKEVKSGTIGTSAKLLFYKDSKFMYEFSVVVYGDLTGEGNVNSRDLTSMMNYLLGKTDLEGCFLDAADVNHKGDINTLDLLNIKRHIEGEIHIDQKHEITVGE